MQRALRAASARARCRGGADEAQRPAVFSAALCYLTLLLLLQWAVARKL